MEEPEVKQDIKNEILAASYLENFNFSRELFKAKHPKATKQYDETKKILEEWLEHQKDKARSSSG